MCYYFPFFVQTPPPIRGSNEEGGNRSGDVKISSPGRAVAATGAYFNRDKMRWEVSSAVSIMVDRVQLFLFLCAFVKLHVTAQPGAALRIFRCYSWTCVFACGGN